MQSLARTYLFCLLAVGTGSVLAQGTDTAFVSAAARSAVSRYTAEIGYQSHLYNGSEYVEYRPQQEEHPYLLEDWVNGAILYDGELYEGIPLMFDLNHDELIISYSYGNKVQLLRDKVKYFTIEGHKYVRLADARVSPGFYDLLYDGKTTFYARRQKKFITKLNGTAIMRLFDELTTYYIVKDGQFRSFKGKRGVLAILADRKREMKKFIRDNRIRFREDREGSVKKMLTYYDNLD